MRVISGILLCAIVARLAGAPAASHVERQQSEQPASAPSKPELAPSLQPLASFLGKWHCDGKFTSGKAISAAVSFEPILNGTFVLFKHDDEPPFAYHAWAEWGWDSAAHQFVSTIEDLTGSTRLFRSPGWTDQTFTWVGGSLPDATDQKFVFERIDSSKFRVSYSYKKNDIWTPVDSSVCSKIPISAN